MTSDPSSWPDPARSGVPANPEQDGYHWLQSRKRNCAPYPALWKAGKGWVWVRAPYLSAPDTAFRYRYLGPCFAASEVAAREAAAAEAMRTKVQAEEQALARVRAEAWREGMEGAAGIADAIMQQAATCAREPDLIPNIRREYLAQSRGAEDVRDAIRARMAEENVR